jgi:hypothetical protein
LFGVSAFCGEAKEPASIKAHQRFGALRIGTLGDHESAAAANVLDVNFRLYVARNRKLSIPQTDEKSALAGTHRQLRSVMSKAHVSRGKITSLCRPELDYLFAFNPAGGNPLALFL